MVRKHDGERMRMDYQKITEIEKIVVPHADLPYEQEHISRFKNFNWSKATKWDAVSFARASGFKEIGRAHV